MTTTEDKDTIAATLLTYLLETNPLAAGYDTIPMDESLYELGILDSAGVIELVMFVETRWPIQIEDSDLTKEKFGGIHKMADLIFAKLNRDPAGEISPA